MNQADFDLKLAELGAAIDALKVRVDNLPPPAPPVDLTAEGATVDSNIAKVNAILPA